MLFCVVFSCLSALRIVESTYMRVLFSIFSCVIKRDISTFGKYAYLLSFRGRDYINFNVCVLNMELESGGGLPSFT